MERLEKYQYLGLMRSGTKADMFTCFNAPTDHATTVKQVTIVVHGVTHTIWSTTYQISKHWHCIRYLHRGAYPKSSQISTIWE